VSKAALFDLDRTLLDCNSGRLWVQSEWRNGRITMGRAVWAGWWLGRYSLGMDDGLDKVFAQAAITLKDEDEDAFSARVREWFDTEVRHRLRPGARAALDRHRAAGDRLVLATTSSSYAGRVACDFYGLDDLICTTFEVEDGVFTGRILHSALGANKADRAREWAQASGFDLAECSFYTDSHSDLALMEIVGCPVAVNPDRVLARIARDRDWEIVDWGLSTTRRLTLIG
jgi:HAD superfamily hydrolase (TIGR01490 family)